MCVIPHELDLHMLMHIHMCTTHTHALNRPLENITMSFSEVKAELVKMGLTFNKTRYIIFQAVLDFLFCLLVDGHLLSALENEVLNTSMQVFVWTCFVSLVYLFQGRVSGPYDSFQIWNSGELLIFLSDCCVH